MSAVLYRRVDVPEVFVQKNADGSRVGGDIRIGDLTGDGQVDFLVYKALGGIKPDFVGAFTIDGEALWSIGDANRTAEDLDGMGLLTTTTPDRPGPVAVYDIDQDGCQEVVCFLLDPDVERTSKWDLDGIWLTILDGLTGAVKCRAGASLLQRCSARVDGKAEIANYVHQRLMIANFSGAAAPQDLVVKIGNDVLAFDCHLNLLWRYTNKYYRYPGHSAYIPAVGDLDGDGLDEVNGGHYGLDHDGSILWERFLGDNADSVLVEPWAVAPGGHAAIVSAQGQVLDRRGRQLLHLGESAVPHGQEVRCGNLRSDLPGRELAIRYAGHRPEIMIVDYTGRTLCRFQVDESPNNTGMEIVRWYGPEEAELLYSPAGLYDGHGLQRVSFPHLPHPSGGKMGWYHCFAADVCGDPREEVLLYDPCDAYVYIYTAEPLDESSYAGYRHTARQYNARLMD